MADEKQEKQEKRENQNEFEKLEKLEKNEEGEIEINNAKEEILEIIERCNLCGLCKELDPVARILREEIYCPRGKVMLFSKKIYGKEVFDFSLSGICKAKCPMAVDIDKAMIKARKILNLKGREHPENKKILNKILNKQNPYRS